MRIKTVISILGQLIIIIGVSMVFPLFWAIYYSEPALPLIIPMIFTILTGLGLFYFVKPSGDVREREAFAIVGLGWLVAALFGMLPFMLSGTFNSVADAFFETMSGFTTTGATVLEDIEVVDKGIIFWRGMSPWLGGMGIMVLFLALLSQITPGRMQMFKAEVPGPKAEKLRPRVRETAKILWTTYVVLSLTQTLLLYLAGLSVYEAFVHTFGTMATGGFSSKNASIGAFSSVVQWIVIMFMFLAGINFSLYYQFLNGKRFKAFWRNEEFLFYLGILLVFSIVLLPVIASVYSEGALRTTVFQVVSITTTTGFSTTDFDQWPDYARGLLVFLMFIGGCAGSTGGSMKVGRWLLLIKCGIRELLQLVRPRAVMSLKSADGLGTQEMTSNVMKFFFIYIFLTAISILIVLSSGVDLITAFTVVAATIGNIGPGLGLIGPAQNYEFFADGYKVFLSFLMLIGRLEIFTILVLFLPTTWKRS